MNSDFPFFTIITPCFNSDKYLRFTIDSVLNQSYKNFEYFIIDGGSTDESNKIIESYADNIDYTISEKDLGMYHALNKGFARGKGEIFCYINSDDILLPNTLAIVAEFFKKNELCDLIYGDVQYIDKDSNYLYTVCYREIFRNEFIYYMPTLIGQPSAFWRSKVFNKLNKFDISFKLASDYDLFVKFFIDEKIKYKYYPICFSSFRVHKDTLSSRFKEINLKEVSKIRKRYKFYLIENIISKINTFFHKFKSLFRYDFARLIFILRGKRIVPFYLLIFFKVFKYRFLSFIKYFHISKKAKIYFQINSQFIICRNVKIMKNVKIIFNKNSSLYIGENTIIRSNTIINVNSSVFIGRDSIIDNDSIIGESFNNIIKNKNTFEKEIEQIYVPENSFINSKEILKYIYHKDTRFRNNY